ncbi:TetR/AcrR family transcriptional regulator [Propioniciclava coleopterorum]|uniref:TetR/AcrR family transcriptional regulator n=1 Tax=Propioniciclava coleopterorum TaxID=2714937 RepID=UPI00198073EC|nr:TetR family transcriptional regulator [Propioniciclava coleopterorum]
MVSDRRERVVDAALVLIGRDGMRALTHRRVDAEAGVPLGTTSNHFRTRRALLEGTLGRLVERDKESVRALGGADPRSVDDLATMMLRYVERSVTVNRALTRARYAMFVELADDERLGGLVLAGREDLTALGSALLGAALGVASQGELRPRAAATVMATVEGMILHRLTGSEASPDDHATLRSLLASMEASTAPR